MSTMTVEISSETYEKYERLARQSGVPVSRLVDQALNRAEVRRQAREKLARLKKAPFDLRQREPVSLGKILKPWNSRAELLEDFFDREDDDDRS